jgi:type I restriction enzyme, S subunit
MKKGWEIKTLGTICEIVNGGTPKTEVIEYWDGNHLWITPAEMGKRQSPYVSHTQRKITDAGLQNSSAQLLPANSVILSSRAPIGHLVINTAPMATNQGCKGLIPNNKLQCKFLYYYLNSIVDYLNSLGTGATFKELSGGKLKEVTIPLPPLPEQQRIVGILDEAFAGISVAKANAEKNLQNARALFESHLSDVFTKRGKGWVAKRLVEVSLINYGYTESASSNKVGPHFLRITDIQNNHVEWKNVPYCPIDHGNLPKYKLSDGDIVFARTGATTGKSYLVNNPPDAIFASYLIRLQLTGKEVLPQFLNLFFQTQSYWDTIHAGVSGSAQGGFNATKLGEIEIPFPCTQTEQQKIVAKFDALSAETHSLATLYEQKLTALAELKKSLLHQAFNGEL